MQDHPKPTISSTLFHYFVVQIRILLAPFHVFPCYFTGLTLPLFGHVKQGLPGTGCELVGSSLALSAVYKPFTVVPKI